MLPAWFTDLRTATGGRFPSVCKTVCLIIADSGTSWASAA